MDEMNKVNEILDDLKNEGYKSFEYICDFSYSCPHCEIETLVLDFIENKEYCSDETMVGVSVGQLRKLAKYYRTHKLKVLQEDNQ